MTEPRPWLDDGDVRLYHGDCLDVLRQLPDRSVHMCATSPPFYGLRDYGVDGQIGLEETPDQWVERLVAVFREVRRVLRDDGTLWVEIGDSYSSGGLGPGADGAKQGTNAGSLLPTAKKAPPGYKPKDLLGQPWLLAFALRADGWYLRSEIIWARPNPMPESVTDRPTKSHSAVFLLSKQPRYFYDADAIREDVNPATVERERHGYKRTFASQFNGHPTDKRHTDGKETESVSNPAGANARSVWTIPTEPTPFAHFATWPQALVRRMVLAGTSEKGCCPECGAPWVRQTERTGGCDRSRPHSPKAAAAFAADVYKGSSETSGLSRTGWQKDPPRRSQTLYWRPSCKCGRKDDDGEVDGLESQEDAVDALSWDGGEGEAPTPHSSRPSQSTHESTANIDPAVVLDPFAGSGTTLLVARNHGRHAVGIELNEQYLEIAVKRLQQLSLLTGDAA